MFFLRFEYCVVNNFTHPPYWVNKTLDEETVDTRLSFSLYWAISMITFTSLYSFIIENTNSATYEP